VAGQGWAREQLTPHNISLGSGTETRNTGVRKQRPRIDAGPDRRGARALAWLVLVVPQALLLWQLGGPAALLSDANTGVHVRAGDWILAHHSAPRRDLFSFTIEGQAWCDWEWLADALYSFLDRRDQLAGIVAVSMAALSLLSVVLYRTACLHARPAVAFAVTSLSMAVTTIHWLARPHLFSWLLLAVFECVIEWCRATKRPGCLCLLPLLMMLWVNLHPGFVLGIALLGVWFLGEGVNSSQRFARVNGTARRQARAWACWFGVIAVACLAATLANPYGIQLHRHVLWYLFSPSTVTPRVTEWLSPNFRNPRLHWFELFLPVSATAGLWSARRRRFAWSMLCLGGLHLALAAVRNVPVYAVLATAPVASLIEGFVEEHSFRVSSDGPGRRKHSPWTRANLWLALAGLLGLQACWSKPLGLAPQTALPRAAIAHLPSGRLFTLDCWADYLIYADSGRRVFLDGRNDLYGSELVRDYLTVMEALPGWQEVLRKHHISVMLVPSTSAISAALASSGTWKVSYRDDRAAIFERL
jgi:hypothetical protein